MAVFSLQVWGPHRGWSSCLDTPAWGGAHVPSVRDCCHVSRPLWLLVTCGGLAGDSVFAVTGTPAVDVCVSCCFLNKCLRGSAPTGRRQAPCLVCSFTFLQRLLGRGRGLQGPGMPSGVRFGCWRCRPQRLRARLSSCPAGSSFPVSINCCLKCRPFSFRSRFGLGLARKRPGGPLSVRWDMPPAPSQNPLMQWTCRLGFGAQCLSELGFEGAGWFGGAACQRRRRYL